MAVREITHARCLGGLAPVWWMLGALLLSVVPSAHAGTAESYVAVLNAEQSAYPSGSRGHGYAVVTLDGDSNLLCYAISATSLLSEDTGSRFLVGSPQGGSAVPIFENRSESRLPGDLRAGCVGPLSEGELVSLRGGRLHLAVATASHPEGEIAGQLVFLSPENHLAIDSLLTLGPGHWRALETLMALDDREWDVLGDLLRRDGVARVSEDGVFSRDQTAAGGELLDAVALHEILAVADVLRGASGGTGEPTPAGERDDHITLWGHHSKLSELVGGHDSQIKQRIPDAPDVRALFQEFDVQDLKDLITKMREEIKDVIAFLQDLRDSGGFQSWKGADCSIGTECHEFKAALEGVLDDLVAVWDGVQRLSCLDDPDMTIRALPGFGVDQGEPELFRRLLLDKAPPAVLYVLSKMFKPFDGWQHFVGDIADRIPAELTTFCNSAEPASRFQAASAASGVGECLPQPFPGSARCCQLRKHAVHNALRVLRAQIKVAILAFEVGESWTTPSKVICMDVTAVAGGGAGTNVPNPTHSADKTIKLILNKLDKLVETLLKEKDQCVGADLRIEEDLLQCNAFSEYLIQEDAGGRRGEVNDLVRRRLALLFDQGIIDQKERDRVEAELLSSPDPDFVALCSEYRKVLNGSNRS